MPNARDQPEVKNQSHVLVPDFRIQLPSSTPALDLAPGETETRLAELKHTCSESHYRTGTRQHNFIRAVDRRAGELMGEYQRKADRMDALLGEGGGGGRVRRQLDRFGDLITVVVGKPDELSEGGHMLLDAMASSRAAMVERRTGMASHETKKEKGVIQGELRRQLSISAPLWSACSTGCTTLVWNGRLTKEQGAGVEGEEGGEGDAVGD